MRAPRRMTRCLGCRFWACTRIPRRWPISLERSSKSMHTTSVNSSSPSPTHLPHPAPNHRRPLFCASRPPVRVAHVETHVARRFLATGGHHQHAAQPFLFEVVEQRLTRAMKTCGHTGRHALEAMAAFRACSVRAACSVRKGARAQRRCVTREGAGARLAGALFHDAVFARTCALKVLQARRPRPRAAYRSMPRKPPSCARVGASLRASSCVRGARADIAATPMPSAAFRCAASRCTPYGCGSRLYSRAFSARKGCK